ncbi:hypothetical protein BDZ91DRAFT_784311 [Kalaharituber pfeilii]|nr:hypothetical protein BDZ91DRAFT_784311 [Kalaharituber pfeilii]
MVRDPPMNACSSELGAGGLPSTIGAGVADSQEASQRGVLVERVQQVFLLPSPAYYTDMYYRRHWGAWGGGGGGHWGGHWYSAQRGGGPVHTPELRWMRAAAYGRAQRSAVCVVVGVAGGVGGGLTSGGGRVRCVGRSLGTSEALCPPPDPTQFPSHYKSAIQPPSHFVPALYSLTHSSLTTTPALFVVNLPLCLVALIAGSGHILWTHQPY